MKAYTFNQPAPSQTGMSVISFVVNYFLAFFTGIFMHGELSIIQLTIKRTVLSALLDEIINADPIRQVIYVLSKGSGFFGFHFCCNLCVYYFQTF